MFLEGKMGYVEKKEEARKKIEETKRTEIDKKNERQGKKPLKKAYKDLKRRQD